MYSSGYDPPKGINQAGSPAYRGNFRPPCTETKMSIFQRSLVLTKDGCGKRGVVMIPAEFCTHPLGQFSLPVKDTDDIQQDVREDSTILDHGIRMVSFNWQAGFLACGSFY